MPTQPKNAEASRPNDPAAVLRWWPSTHNPAIASHRLRCLQIVAELRRQGLDSALYDMRDARPPDVLVLSKRYDDASLDQAVALRRLHGTRLVLDLCDNHFDSEPAAEPRWQARAATLRRAVRAVDLVICATAALADRVGTDIGAAPPADQPPRITVVGDAVEAAWQPRWTARWRYPQATWQAMGWARWSARQVALQAMAGGPLRQLVWFGQHGTQYSAGGMADLLTLRARLEQAHAQKPLSLTVISNQRAKYESLIRPWAVPTFYLDWHPSHFSQVLAGHQIAVLPVIRNAFTLCKSNNRLATALLHGLAVAADGIPSYQAFSDGATLDDWGGGLQRLLDDPAHRAAQQRIGVARVRADWQLPQIAAQWRAALATLAAPAPTAPPAPHTTLHRSA